MYVRFCPLWLFCLIFFFIPAIYLDVNEFVEIILSVRVRASFFFS